MSVLARASWRHLVRHPWQSVLAILGITLGVAVVVSIDVAGASSQRAFEISSERVTGRATHRIVGGPTGVPVEAYRTLRVELGIRDSAPVVDTRIALADHPRTLQLLGVDLFAEAPFRDWGAHDGARAGADWGPGLELLTERMTGLISSRTASELGLDAGDRLELSIDEQTIAVEIETFGAEPDASSSMDDLLVVDIGTAQEIVGEFGTISRIDAILTEADVAQLRSKLDPGLQIVRSEARSQSAENMTSAFRINLRALSLLALVCGAFLIFNTMTFSIVQRRSVIATQRALGVSRKQIFRVVLIEALVIGLIGSILGTIAGIALARLLLDAVVQTVNDFYFSVQVRELNVTPWRIAQSVALGVGAAVVAALRPAREASRATPSLALRRSSIEDASRRNAPRQALMALALVAVGGALAFLGRHSLLLSFGALFAILVGGSLVTPWLTIGFSKLTGRLFAKSGTVPRLAAGALRRHLSRTSVAVAALAIAVSVSVGIGLMIRSFRSTVENWLEFSLPADFYLTQTTSLPSDGGIDPEIVRAIGALPEVARANTLRHLELEVELEEPILLTALDIDERSHGAFRLKSGDSEVAWQDFHAGSGVLISEPFSIRRSLGVGDSVTLPSGKGPVTLPIRGVFYDYSSDRGVVLMHRRAYIEMTGDRRITAVSFFLSDPTRIESAEHSMRELIGTDSRYALRSNRTLREQSLAIFDRTFLVTRVLRLLVTLVAFVGILSALMAIQLERAREIGVLRALGFTRSQVWRLVTTETGLLGLVAALLALPLGLATASMMVYVINKRSFGWTMPLQVDPTVFFQAALLAVVPALLAGALPAWRISRTTAAEALRDE